MSVCSFSATGANIRSEQVQRLPSSDDSSHEYIYGIFVVGYEAVTFIETPGSTASQHVETELEPVFLDGDHATTEPARTSTDSAGTFGRRTYSAGDCASTESMTQMR